MQDLCCDWSAEQIAYAMHRHILHGLSMPEPTIKNLMALKKWWRESKYPEPMKIEQGNFIPASCYEWAVECFAKAV